MALVFGVSNNGKEVDADEMDTGKGSVAGAFVYGHGSWNVSHGQCIR
jgi:hypothetical protein